MACAQPGMPRNGKAKPVSRIAGMRKKNDICTTCDWLHTTVEKVKPMARLTVMNSIVESVNSTGLPSKEQSKQDERAASQHDDHLHGADDDVGRNLPAITSKGRTGMASRFSMVPRSYSRVTASAVIITMVMVRMMPRSPGTML